MINEINTKKEFSKYLENYLKKYKNIFLTCTEFIKFSKKFYYSNRLNKKFDIKETMFKNLYYKIKRNLNQLNLEDIFEYAKKLSNGEYFCRYIGYKILISKEKKIIENKSFIFFTDFDIKRLIASEHLLIDGTFVYPMDYMQTIIIMYYDVIIEKMIPGIFIIINNKTLEGYKDSFTYIKEYIIKSNNQSRKKFKFKTFTTDFEIALFKAFNEVFNEGNEIKHIGCYFHYLQNIRKYLQKNGLTAKKNIEYYNSIINICKSFTLYEIKIIKDIILYKRKS